MCLKMTDPQIEQLPPGVSVNAWAGSTPHSDLDPAADRWGSQTGLPKPQKPLALGVPADPKNWADPSVGYGVLLPDDDSLPDAVKAVAGDAPAPIRELIAARPGTVVLRWRADLDTVFKVRRHFVDRPYKDLRIGLTPFGTRPDQLPRYIVIVADPKVIPWSAQYQLNLGYAVGRLPLAEEGLGNYIDAMLNDFADAEVDVRAPMLWTVSLPGDITAQMSAVIAEPLAEKLTDPQLPRFEYLTGGAATGADLIARLTSVKPALLVTSSHGLTIGEGDALRAGLGLPVDATHAPVPLDALVASLPSGAIWHAQACCSAGSDAGIIEGQSNYHGLLQPGEVLTIVDRVAALGPSVAPAAIALLGRASPVRAVVGHVEPTFDWTLRDEHTGQGLGAQLVAALSTNLFAGQPIGLAFEAYRYGVGRLNTDWQKTRALLSGKSTWVRPALTRMRLTAMDRQSLVLLGDPTVTLPALQGAP